MQSEWYVGEPTADGIVMYDREALFDEEPRYVTFNGRTDALVGDNALTMGVGERARIYMVNEGLNLASNFHPIGSQSDLVYPEAATHPSNRVIRGSQSTLVVAGGGTVVELQGLVPSRVILVDHALVRTFYKGAIGFVDIAGDEQPEIFSAGTTRGDVPTGGGVATAPNDSGDTEPLAFNEVLIPMNAFDPANAATAFSPGELRVRVGTTVTWTNGDIIAHTVTSGVSDGAVATADARFDSGLFEGGATFSYTFDEPGEYPYFCTPHPWMKGMVIVEA